MKKTIDQVYSPETLRKLQMIELEILAKFDAMCKKYGLHYFAAYGTLLGAVRHKGIIPWDDDIDIAMPREDFDRVKDLVSKEMGDDYDYLSSETNDAYPFVTARITKKGTEFRTLPMKKIPCDFGVFLDIFPLDNLPDEENERKKMFRKAWLWDKLHILRSMPFPNSPFRGIKRIVVYMGCAVLSLLLKLFPQRAIYTRWRKIATRWAGKETGYLAYCAGVKPYIYRREMLFPEKQLPFENMFIPVPQDEKGVLAMNFGPDYMIPAPEGKRSSVVPYRLNLGDGVLEK